MEPTPAFRDEVLGVLKRELGEPCPIAVGTGKVYRWKVRCPDERDVSIYVTLDAPELPEYAHVLISDPHHRGPDPRPIIDFAIRKRSELPTLLAAIRGKIAGCDEGRPTPLARVRG